MAGDERARLAAGLERLGLGCADAAPGRLLAYASLLRKWNRAYNLVAAGDLADLVPRHLLDSLAIQPFLAPGNLLDVGTGAGFPGLPLAICDPSLDCTLLDSAGKKVLFLRHVVRALKLANAHPVKTRVEDFESDRKFDNITSRAFSSLAAFGSAVRHLAGSDTRLLAMKGRHPGEELAALPAWLSVKAVETVEVPDLHAQRHLVIMSVLPA